MTLADIPWIYSDQRPHGVLAYDAAEVDWVDAAGDSPLGVVQPVSIDSEFEVSFVIPGNVEPTSDLLDSALPDLQLWLAYDLGDAPSELVFVPSDETESEITASWTGDAPASITGLPESADELGWTPEQRGEVERWVGSTVDLARRLRPHIESVAERIESDIAGGFTISMPFGENELISGGYMATVLLPTDVPDEALDPDAVTDLGIDGARAWTAVTTHFPSLFLLEACGYFGFDVVDQD